MEFPNLTPVFVSFGALLLGWVIGFFDSNLRTRKKIKEAEKKAESAIKEAQDRTADAESRLSILASTVPDDAGILRLKQQGTEVSLELDGEKISSSALTAEQKKRLVGLLTLMRPWLETESAAGAARPVAVPHAEPTPRESVRPEPAPLPMPSLVPEGKLPEAKKPTQPPLSIVEQINAILQLRMMGTPLSKHDIRLQESHEGGVEVMVGIKKYETVEDVPDPEIKAAIRKAIEEWEKKYTPGL
jgi:hypothetical protein